MQFITDNGKQIKGKKLGNFCENNGIKLSFALVYHPQANRQVDVTNRTITTIIKRKAGDNLSRWADLVPEAMWAYKMIVRRPMGHPPCAFGIGVVAPTELVWPTACELQ